MAEQYWYNVLTFDERIHYERCVHAIVRYYGHDIPKLSWFTGYAMQEYSHIPLIAAIVWRIREELSDD